MRRVVFGYHMFKGEMFLIFYCAWLMPHNASARRPCQLRFAAKKSSMGVLLVSNSIPTNAKCSISVVPCI